MKKITNSKADYLLKKYGFVLVFIGWMIVSAFIFSFVENKVFAFFIIGGGIILIIASISIRLYDHPLDNHQDLIKEVEKMQEKISEQEKIVAESEGMNVTKPVNEDAAKQIVARLIAEKRKENQPPY